MKDYYMEKSLSENRIEIKLKGSYFEIDENGFIVNPSSLEKIQPEWSPVIDDVVGLYKKVYGENLKNVYIRGSVAKGEAIKGISDLDTFAYVNLSKENLKKELTEKLQGELEAKYEFVDDIEVGAHPLSEISDDKIMLNQSVCVYGEAIDVPKMKAGKEMATHSPTFYNRFEWFGKFLETEEGEEENKKVCVWLMKGLLRVGFELTMERSGKYTRDLYRCYETFVKYYPEKQTEMRQVLDLALNPTGDKSRMKEIMENLGVFLLSEIPKYFLERRG